MSDALTAFRSFPPEDASYLEPAEYDKAVRKFLSTLKGLSAKTWTTGDVGPLESLDPTQNSIPYVIALNHLINNAQPKNVNGVPDQWRPQGALWDKAVQFLGSFDPVQVRYVGSQWRNLLEYIGRVASVLGQERSAIVPVRTAILRLDPSGGTITSNHLHLVRWSMEGAAYAQAAPLLAYTIHSFPASNNAAAEAGFPCASYALSSGFITVRSGLTEKVSALDVQEYFLLGAMALLGLQRYDDAKLLLEHVLVTPTSNVANIFMLEAYKKWLLVTALVEGRRLEPPRTSNRDATKQLRAASRAYEHIVDVLQSGDYPRLLAEHDAGLKIWNDDGNFGLVTKLLESHPRFALYKLQKIYASIPLPRLVGMLDKEPAEVEPYLQTLIDNGQINATIQQGAAEQPKVLRFTTNTSSGTRARSEKQQFEQLASFASKTAILTEQVEAADHRLTLSKEYIELEKRRRATAAEKRGGGEAMDTSWDATKDGLDEDVMGDI